jgi:hypothetical protein
MLAEPTVIDQKHDVSSFGNALRSARRYGLVYAVYVPAIVVATIGWLWLIAWTAMQLI